MIPSSTPKTILVFRSGYLGDTLLAIPALRCLREAYPTAKIIYLYQKSKTFNRANAKSILEHSGLIDAFICDYMPRSRLLRALARFALLLRLRLQKIDLAIILEASYWPDFKRQFFLRVAGVKNIIGPEKVHQRIVRGDDGYVKPLPHIADQLLDVLRPLGIPIPKEHQGKTHLQVSPLERLRVEKWCNDKKIGDGPRIAIALSSNWATKKWPTQNYLSVIRTLISEFDVVPIFFGGPADREEAEEFVSKCGRGAVAAGELTVREGIHLLSTAELYLGNDTGVMHMAVASGIPCVAVFSSVDAPGLWEPYGGKGVVFRTQISCEGCLLHECIEHDMKCIRAIIPEEVLTACRRFFEKDAVVTEKLAI